VFDLYCGIGTISLYISRYVREVTGVEIAGEAVKDAKINAKINEINNAFFYEGAAEHAVKSLGKADVVIIDPPRKGCDKSLLDTISEISPDKIIYVSCNPATLARDLKILSGYGFETKIVQPVDMFPRTAHVECVVLMSRVKD
jgi:23S rRNA (uracil1939-C5)-methyltransferase